MKRRGLPGMVRGNIQPSLLDVAAAAARGSPARKALIHRRCFPSLIPLLSALVLACSPAQAGPTACNPKSGDVVYSGDQSDGVRGGGNGEAGDFPAFGIDLDSHGFGRIVEVDVNGSATAEREGGAAVYRFVSGNGGNSAGGTAGANGAAAEPRWASGAYRPRRRILEASVEEMQLGRDVK